MVWRETINHLDNCYFKFVDVPGFNKKTKQHLQYDIPSARQPVALSEEIHAPLTTELPEIEVEPSVHLLLKVKMMRQIFLSHLVQIVTNSLCLVSLN